MKKKYKFLVLTDHSSHNITNSLYTIVNHIAEHDRCELVHVATRADEKNHGFYFGLEDAEVYAIEGDETFSFEEDGSQFDKPQVKVNVRDYDVIMMRLPRPISDQFLLYVDELLEDKVIINRPKGILATSNKSFLLDFPDLCPPMKLCHSVEEIMHFAADFPVVLKPLRGYGGAGILKLEGDEIFDQVRSYPAWAYLNFIEDRIEKYGYLVMKFLKNVSMGDKRILVVGGQPIAASLRLPPKDSWLCNVSLGGRSVFAEVDENEQKMIDRLNPRLHEEGIFIYGLDTLTDDDGKRILSEVNTLSVGGFANAAKQHARPVLPVVIQNLLEYVDQKYR